MGRGQYFFTDIKAQGIALYEADIQPLAKPSQLTPAECKAIAEKHFAQWFDSAKGFMLAYDAVLKAKELKNAAFQLHQATERYFACLLLVFTNYKPNTHNLVRLNSLAISQDKHIAEIFPQETKIERRCFQLLRSAYIDARYSEHYRITEDELNWLAGRVANLQKLTERLCKEKIVSFQEHLN